MSIKNTYRRFRTLGISAKMDVLEQKRIALLNEICIWIILLEFVNYILVLSSGSTNIGGFVLVQVFISIPLIFNYFHKTETAKWFLIILGNIVITFLIILFGKDFNQDYCYLITSILIIILLPKLSHRIFHLSLSFVFYFATWFYLNDHPPLINEPNAELATASTFIFTLVICSVLLWRFVRISKNIQTQFNTSLNKIQEKNKAIEIDQFQIQQQHKSLEAINKELERFAFMASNDLQSPLNDILHHLKNIQNQLETHQDESVQEYLDFASNSAKRMKIIIQDVLAFSKIENGKIKLEPTDLNQVMQTVLLNIKETIDKRSAEVNIQAMPIIQAMPTQITLLFQNLIENGIKYNITDTPKVTVSHQLANDFHIFKIQDNGIGIPESDQQKVFEMFQRLKDKREEQGSGIGLAICKKIVEQHHGSISIESNSTQGITFIIQMPVSE